MYKFFYAYVILVSAILLLRTSLYCLYVTNAIITEVIFRIANKHSIHSDDILIPFDCDNSCFNQFYNLILDRRRNINCDKCGKRYSLKATLQKHQKYECGTVAAFQCPFCPSKTKQKYNLMTHAKSVHPEKLEDFKTWYYQVYTKK